MKVLLFAKPKPYLDQVVQLLEQYWRAVDVRIANRGDPFPEDTLSSTPDLLISYLSPWIVPIALLANTRRWAINFHPGPPEYPGTGCFNFALYDGAANYGVTAHLMKPKVDSGKIVAVSRFPIEQSDSVLSLAEKSYVHLFRVFSDVVQAVRDGSLPECEERWARSPYTRKELDALCEIKPEMTRDEVDRRVRATYFPGMPGPFLNLYGMRFNYSP